MKLIIGLGNPGEKYKKTRHNAGFMVIDSMDKKSSSKLILAKPRTFMNESGKAVKEMVKKYAVKTPDLLLIHDDLDISFGSFKLQFGKGPHQHNGVASIEDCLGSKEFWRLRVGIDNRQIGSKQAGEDYVLGKFATEELKSLKILIESQLIPAVQKWISSRSI